MKYLRLIILILGIFFFQQPFAFSQYAGGAAADSTLDTLNQVSCPTSYPIIMYATIFVGGAAGDTTLDTLNQVSCPSSYPSIIYAAIFTGGAAGDTTLDTLNQVSCPPSAYPIIVYATIFTGGAAADTTLDTLNQVICPVSYPITVYANIFIGGASADSSSDSTKCILFTACPVLATAKSDTSICFGSSVMLTASGGISYSWLTGNVADTTATLTVKPSATTIYSVNVANDSCANNANVTVTVLSLPTPKITGTSFLCKGDTATLTATGGNTYLWSNGDTTKTIKVKTKGVTIYKLTAYNGTCSDSTTTTITPLPASDSITGPSTICKGKNAVLTVVGGKSYLWNRNVTDTLNTITVNPPSDSTYTVIVQDSTCRDTLSQTITVVVPPVASISGDTILCAGKSTTLTAKGGTIYNWNTGDTLNIITVKPTKDTIYIVRVSNVACADSASVKVKVNPLPKVDAGKDITITDGEDTTLSVTGATNYLWTPVTGLSSTGIANPVANPTTTTTYIVTGTDANGCSSSDTLMVIVVTKPVTDSCGEAFIPNAFSPNNNTFNDVFRVRMPANCVKDILFTVYDRWGVKIFETTDITTALTKGWDGTYQGKELNTAVFVYYLKATLNNGNEVHQKGNVSLVR